MATKKDIGKVFKEHFKDFEQAPDAGIWDSIASELDKKASRRIIPLWYYFGGLIVVGLIGSIWFFTQQTDKNIPQNIITVGTSQQDNKNILQNDTNQHTNSIINLEDQQSITRTSQTKSSEASESEILKNTPATKNTTASTAVKIGNQTANTATQQKENTSQNQTANSKYSKELAYNKNDTKPSEKQPEVTVATIKNLIKLEKEKRNTANKEALARYQAKIKLENEEALNVQREENAKSIAEQLAQNQIEEKAKEAKEQNKDKEEGASPKTEEERFANRKESVKYQIAISPYTSIQSYGSLTRASSLDDRLVNNPRQAISTLGYGIRAAYTLTERTRLRLGVGYSPLKYRTDNFQVSISNGNINIFELAAISGQALSQGGTTTENTPEAIAFFNNNNVVSIQQNISYIEVPLDFQYMFLNKRVGLSVSPGVSLFILDDNSIIASADNGSSVLVGNESNLTGVSLAFNIGLGAHYNFNPNWRFNMEPVFRYQLNPYNNSTSNFRPYYFGAQFGLSYKF